VLNRFAICAALVALEAGSAAAQEREAILQKTAVPGTSFEMLVATAKSPDVAIYDLGDTPDTLVIHLIGASFGLVSRTLERSWRRSTYRRSESGAFMWRATTPIQSPYIWLQNYGPARQSR
jgi:hypothetical protein